MREIFNRRCFRPGDTGVRIPEKSSLLLIYLYGVRIRVRFIYFSIYLSIYYYRLFIFLFFKRLLLNTHREYIQRCSNFWKIFFFALFCFPDIHMVFERLERLLFLCFHNSVRTLEMFIVSIYSQVCSNSWNVYCHNVFTRRSSLHSVRTLKVLTLSYIKYNFAIINIFTLCSNFTNVRCYKYIHTMFEHVPNIYRQQETFIVIARTHCVRTRHKQHYLRVTLIPYDSHWNR